MRIVASFVLAAMLVGAAGAFAQSRTTEPPPTDSGFLCDQGAPSMFELPDRSRFTEDGTPSNIVPRLAWLRADYLFWTIKRPITPPLVQTIPDNLANSSSLPANAANTLFPEDGQHVRYRTFAGARLNAGCWFSTEQRFGIDGTFFMLEQNSNGAGYASTGSPALARFYVNANNSVLTNLQFSNPTAATGYSGSLSAVSTMAPIWGVDANLRWNGFAVLSDNTDWLLGARYFDMRENLQIRGQANLNGGTTLNVNDYFKVSNQFYGGQVGLHARWGNYYGFSVDGIFKVAVGGVDQQVTIRGDNTLTTRGVATTQQTGLYTQAGNIGIHERGKIAVLPEVALNLNYSLTDHAAVFIGYNFMYLSSVMRAGNAIDQRVNDSSIRYISNPTSGSAAGPVFRYNAEGFWMHGANLGLRLEY